MSKNNEIHSLINKAKSEAKIDSIKVLFVKNSKIFLTIFAALVIFLVSYAGFNIYQNSQEAKFSEIFHQALIDQQSGNINKAKESLQKIYQSSAPSGVKSLASMRYAAILLDENKKSEAGVIYQNISKCGNCDSYIKDLAGLLAVKTWLSDESETQKEDLISRIEKIESDSKELHYQISEQKALFLLQKNDLAKAYEVFDSIAKSPEALQSLKSRAEDGLKMITAKGYQPFGEEKLIENTEKNSAAKTQK